MQIDRSHGRWLARLVTSLLLALLATGPAGAQPASRRSRRLRRSGLTDWDVPGLAPPWCKATG